MKRTVPPESWMLALRDLLAAPPPRRLPPSEQRPSAVLVPLFVDAGQLWVLLTRRSDDLPQHRSQIAFPGGSLEPGETPWQAALRESEEELGIDPAQVVPLGQLDEIGAEVSNFRIVPCVAAVPYPLTTTPNPDEVAEVFPVPLLAFLDPRLVEERTVRVDGRSRTLRMYHVGTRIVWGLTAQILGQLTSRLGLGTPAEPPES